MRRMWAALVVLAALLAAPASAFGHSELVSAEPATGSTVEGPNVSIVLVFSEPLADGSKADLLGPSGATVTFGPDPADPMRMTPITSEPLTFEPGAYTIEWTSVAADGDILRGVVRFTVTAPPPTPTAAPSDTPAPTTSPTAAPTSAPSPTPTATSDDGGSGNNSVVILPIVVALVVVAFFAWRLMRSGTRSP